jgi:hypothetical protein
MFLLMNRLTLILLISTILNTTNSALQYIASPYVFCIMYRWSGRLRDPTKQPRDEHLLHAMQNNAFVVHSPYDNSIN